MINLSYHLGVDTLVAISKTIDSIRELENILGLTKDKDGFKIIQNEVTGEIFNLREIRTGLTLLRDTIGDPIIIDTYEEDKENENY